MNTKNTPFFIITLVFAISLSQPSTASDFGFEEICNKGESWLYFATIAKRSDYLSPNSVAQGFNAIAPGSCRSMLPYGNRTATIAFFKQDKNGVFANVEIVPENSTSSSEHIDMMCVRPSLAYREYGSRQDIIKRFTPPCQPGYLPAKTSFTFVSGSNDMTINVSHSNQVTLRAWGDGTVPKKRRPQLIWEAEKDPNNQLVQENVHAKRDREVFKLLQEKTGQFIDKLKREQAERRAQQYQRQMKIRAEQQRQLEKAIKAVEKPTDETCAVYLPKKKFNNANDVSIAGVKVSMDVKEAHKALLCNGFSIDARVIARSGGLEKFLQGTRPRVYKKQLDNGDIIIAELENRVAKSDANKKVVRSRRNRLGSRNQADIRKYEVLSVRTRHKLAKPIALKGDEWKTIKSNFNKTYAVGRKKHENNFSIRYFLKTDAKQVSLSLHAHTRHPSKMIYMIDLTMI